MAYTFDDVLKRHPQRKSRLLPAPPYEPPEPGEATLDLGLAVKSMENHTSPEGWEVFRSLEGCGYVLLGHGIEASVESKGERYELSHATNVKHVLGVPGIRTVFFQDKREWDPQPGDFRDHNERFRNIQCLKDRSDVWKGTILKDAHQRPDYHRGSADEVNCHFWVTYYNPRIVCHLAPYVRREHLVRTYHTVDPAVVPPYTEDRKGCVISGALGGCYPLRRRLIDSRHRLPETDWLRHPGYHRKGACTPSYLKTLSGYKVSVATCSSYAYALRKLVEGTAAGCVVVTDLPADEVMPEIDGNLVRLHADEETGRAAEIIAEALRSYDPERQRMFAEKALKWYDFREVGMRLAADIEILRLRYNGAESS